MALIKAKSIINKRRVTALGTPARTENNIINNEETLNFFKKKNYFKASDPYPKFQIIKNNSGQNEKTLLSHY